MPKLDHSADYPDGTELYVHTLNDGTTIALPRFNQPKIGELRRLRKLDELNQAFEIFESRASAKALAASDELDQEEWSDLYRDWIADGGVPLGK